MSPLELLESVRHSGDGWVARCPSHDDRVQSLSIHHREGLWLLYCHAGCDTGIILKEMGLTFSDLNDEETQTQVGSIHRQGARVPSVHEPESSPSLETETEALQEEARYDYRDEAGRLLYTNVRFKPKTFRLQKPDGTWGINGSRRVLFRLPELLAADPTRWVFLVEGEKDVNTLVEKGFIATTSGGATSWRAEYAPYFKGRNVAIIPDNDEPGREFGRRCQSDVSRVAKQAVALQLSGGAKDVSDWFASGGQPEILKQLVLDASTNPAPSLDEGPIQASKIVQEEVKWLWNQRIPFGKITILEGDPGLGKSTLSTEIASILSRGSSLPSGPALKPAASLILTVEDGASDTVLPRLHASGANLDMVHVLSRPLSILKDLDKIATWLRTLDCRLLIIDPLMAYLGARVNSWSDQEVRQVLSPLAHVAQTTGTAVMVLRHLNKDEDKSPLYRGGGSIGIIGAARSGLVVNKSESNANVRILSSVKSNLGPPPLPLYYTLESAGQVARVRWVGDADGTTLDGRDHDKAMVEAAKRLFQ